MTQTQIGISQNLIQPKAQQVVVSVHQLVEAIDSAKTQSKTFGFIKEELQVVFCLETKSILIGHMADQEWSGAQVKLPLSTNPENEAEPNHQQAHIAEVHQASNELHAAVGRLDSPVIEAILNSPYSAEVVSLLELRQRKTEPIKYFCGDQENSIEPLPKLSSVVLSSEETQLTGTIKLIKGSAQRFQLRAPGLQVDLGYRPGDGDGVHQLSLSQGPAMVKLVLNRHLVKSGKKKCTGELISLEPLQTDFFRQPVLTRRSGK